MVLNAMVNLRHDCFSIAILIDKKIRSENGTEISIKPDRNEVEYFPGLFAELHANTFGVFMFGRIDSLLDDCFL